MKASMVSETNKECMSSPVVMMSFSLLMTEDTSHTTIASTNGLDMLFKIGRSPLEIVRAPIHHKFRAIACTGVHAWPHQNHEVDVVLVPLLDIDSAVLQPRK